MKIKSIKINNHKRSFEISTPGETYSYPFSRLNPPLPDNDSITDVTIDNELGREAFTYKLQSGMEESIHLDQVLDYNQDPGYMRDLLLYKLTIESQRRLDTSKLSKREIIRRLGTSPAQFYRLIDSANYSKSIDKVLELLHVLDCEVELVVRDKSA